MRRKKGATRANIRVEAVHKSHGIQASIEQRLLECAQQTTGRNGHRTGAECDRERIGVMSELLHEVFFGVELRLILIGVDVDDDKWRERTLFGLTRA